MKRNMFDNKPRSDTIPRLYFNTSGTDDENDLRQSFIKVVSYEQDSRV